MLFQWEKQPNRACEWQDKLFSVTSNMQQSQAKALLKNAITGNKQQRWADLGCGSGTFTIALASLLPAGSHITAIDRQVQRFDETNIDFQQADFVHDLLPLTNLDGILMANSFHYVSDKMAMIKKLEPYFTHVPLFIFVEYDTMHANKWVPFPISFSTLTEFFALQGYTTTKLADHPSNFGGKMYSALVHKNK